MDFYLASQSPRRKQLLEQVHLNFQVLAQSAHEPPPMGEPVVEYVESLALLKARAGFEMLGGQELKPVLGADTIVVFEGQVFGKPRDYQQAKAMLSQLSGGVHQVITAVAVKTEDKEQLIHCQSEVCFATISEDEIKTYWQSGEPQDKAGAYGIQGLAAVFVKEIRGSYTNIVGLPLYETVALLSEFGISPWR